MELTPGPLPVRAGVSLKPQHYHTILNDLPDAGWFELHPENYMGRGGIPHKYLAEIRSHYALSMHGVGMSLGSAEGIDTGHLASLRELVDRYQPAQVSEHLAWSHFNNMFLNDLLPLPYHRQSLETMSANITHVQDVLERTILIENPSAYIDFENSTWSEPGFLAELVRRTGCGLLLDVNNIFVSACNQGFDPLGYLQQIPNQAVAEIHLAGHSVQSIDGVEVRIDDHGSEVCDPVWQLYESTLVWLGRRVPVLIEWDTDVPDLDVLMNEAARADDIAKKAQYDTEQTAA